MTLLALAVGVAAVPAIAAVTMTDDTVTVSADGYAVALDRASGSIVSVTGDAAGAICRSGEYGLWQVRFRDNSVVNAADLAAEQVSVQADQGANTVTLDYQGDEVNVSVVVTGRGDGIELAGQVTPRTKVVLDFALPARLRFDPEQVARFICPENGNQSVGTAFNGRFFQLQPQDRPAAWAQEAAGPQGYEALFGGPLDQRADREAAVPLRVTDEGREWLPDTLAQRVATSQAMINRPSTRGQVDLVVVDSDNGPYIAASDLGGEGHLWRVGGAVGDTEKGIVAEVVEAVARRLVETAPAGRTKIGLVALMHGPSRGGWCDVEVGEWRQRLDRAAQAGKRELVELATPDQMLEAAGADDYVAILNPYGEWLPAPIDGDLNVAVRAVGEYVRGGGNWFEVGGYPFFYALRPVRYLSHGSTYPDAFADFFHLETKSGSASIYRVQPLDREPWAGAQDPAVIFVPGRLQCGGDEQGGYCDRPFATYVEPGDTWRAPAVRLTVGNTPEEGLRAYCEANEIRRRLEEKMAPDVLERFRNSVLVYYAGSCRDKLAYLDLLPVPTQVHFADYLRGGFDKQYPDHLPPRPDFGTPEEFRRFFDRCHELGHLVMPYTNPTWWCDHPKGPTFEREGTDPLLKTLDGQLSYERYAANDGYTVCHWHPAARAANRKTVQEFTEEYPVDILFQDQCGARGWQYDTNPASPTPYAYTDGLLSMVAEDSRVHPLSTEAGWDRVVNGESQLCGMTWSLVPTEGGPSWRTAMKEQIPTDVWEIYPLAQQIAHDKTAMLYHDLGQFVTNQQVLSWTLGLGFCMSYRVAASALTKDAPREWLRWLDRVQKSICSRYVGEPVVAFDHRWPDESAPDDDGIIRATYGDVQIVANLGPGPITEGDMQIAGYGFRATAPGLSAAHTQADAAGDAATGHDAASFVCEKRDDGFEVWVYSPAGRQVVVDLGAVADGDYTVDLDGQAQATSGVRGGKLSVALPARAAADVVQPPPELAGNAPAQWPGEKPAIGIIDLGEDVHPVWTSIQPQQWLEAFAGSQPATEAGLTVSRLTSIQAITAALEAGPARWFAIVNPYGEVLPAAEGQWREMLTAIRNYVDNGGSWWEVGGYSFYSAASPGAAGWHTTPVGAAGIGVLGLPVGGGDVDQPPEPLRVTPVGRAVFGEALSADIEQQMSPVNRALARGPEDPGHVTLVAGRSQDFIGAYRLNGWGYLWRIGGFNPNPSVALSAAVAAMEYLYSHPPVPVPGGSVQYLWHARVTRP